MSQFRADTLDNRSQLDVIDTDLSKAFDTIDHQLLLFKLSSIGFSELLIKLIASYLSSRLNLVMCNGFISNSYISTSGVPQGSVMGPLLFIIYINDVVEVIKNSHILMYADDIKIFRKIESPDDCLLLQMDLENIQQWCIANCLLLNHKKCKVVTYSLCQNLCQYVYYVENYPLERLRSVKDLGVYYDSEYSFRVHVNNVVLSAGKILGFMLRNCKDFNNISTLTVLYNALVRSRLEYCSLAWFPYYYNQMHQIENVQRRFLKFF